MSLILPPQHTLSPFQEMLSLTPRVSVNLSHPLAQELRGWWRVNALGYGTNTWYDLIGNNNGTFIGKGVHGTGGGWGRTTHAGGHGEVFFDGSSGYIDMGVNSRTGVLNFGSQDFSIVFWINDKSATGLGIILNKTSGVATNGYDIASFAGLTGQWGFRINSSTICQSPTAFNDGKWHHLVCSYQNSTRAMSLYIDSTLVASATSASFVAQNSSASFQIGARAGVGGLSPTSFDDLLIFGRYLSFLDVNALYQSSLYCHPGLLLSPRVRYYSFATSVSGMTVLATPSRSQYQAQTPTTETGIRITAAQSQYQAQTPRITIGVVATPSRAQVQVQTPIATMADVVVSVTPARAQYQGQTPQVTRGVVATPARAQYQASTATVTVAGPVVAVTPGQAKYQAQTPQITLGVVATPSRAQYRASTPTIPENGTVVEATPSRAQYQAQTPRITLGVIAQPGRSQYQAQTPQITQGFFITPSRAQYQAQTPTLSRGPVTQPAQAQYQAQAPRITLGVVAQPSRAQYQAQTPQITMTVVASPVQGKYQTQTPQLGQTVVVQGAQGQYQALTPLTSRSVLVTPSQGRYYAPMSQAVIPGMGNVSGAPSLAQYQAPTGTTAALEVIVAPYSKQASGIFLQIQTTADVIDTTILTVHPGVVLRL